MIENYLTIMEDSLKQKLVILDEIAVYSKKQEELLKQDKLSFDEFDVCVDKKDALIQKLAGLDEGFEALYERIKVQLQENRHAYQNQIARLQILVRQVTEKGIFIQAQESRNKTMVEQHFKDLRKEMKQSRQKSKAAYDYYRSMNNTNVMPPQFLDQKK